MKFGFEWQRGFKQKDFLIIAYLYLFISEFLWLCRVAALKSLTVHPFYALIFPILRDCLQSVSIFSGDTSVVVLFFVFWSRVFVLFEPYERFHILVQFG